MSVDKWGRVDVFQSGNLQGQWVKQGSHWWHTIGRVEGGVAPLYVDDSADDKIEPCDLYGHSWQLDPDMQYRCIRCGEEQF